MAVIEQLIGVTLVSAKASDSELVLLAYDGTKFRFNHHQDCCESVYIESIVGDLEDLVGTPLVLADESSSSIPSEDYESGTWTFYKFATRKGYVDVRWVGRSNGYYSEGVSLDITKPGETEPSYY